MKQLLLFQDVKFKISYWDFPFDEKGMYIKNQMQLYEEIVPEHRLKDMLNTLELCECYNIKYQPIN
jgi:hypothetical protein